MTAKRSPTNSDLAQKIDDVSENLGKRLEKVEAKVATFHDFMIVQQDRQSNVRNASGSINWFELAKQFLVFLTVAASIILVIVQVFADRVKQ